MQISPEQFERALSSLAARLTPEHLRLLVGHYHAPGRRFTATEAAAAVGYSSYRAVNLQYGRLARAVADALRLPMPEASVSTVLVTFIPPGAEGNLEWLWVMRPELAAALESLGWVRPDPPEPTLRLVTWNCARGGARKMPHVRQLRPDVLAVRECGRPETDAATNFVWEGPKPNHGLLVTASDPWTLTPGPPPPTDFGVYAAATVRGPTTFRLLAVWTKPSDLRKGAYVRSLHKALDHYADWLKAGTSVIMGDFNANPGWPGRPEQKVWGDRLADEFGLVSAYHAARGAVFGFEPEPTFHLWRRRSEPWHLDFCFIPTSWAHRLRRVTVGCHDLWSRYSDHCPLTVDASIAPGV